MSSPIPDWVFGQKTDSASEAPDSASSEAPDTTSSQAPDTTSSQAPDTASFQAPDTAFPTLPDSASSTMSAPATPPDFTPPPSDIVDDEGYIPQTDQPLGGVPSSATYPADSQVGYPYPPSNQASYPPPTGYPQPTLPEYGQPYAQPVTGYPQPPAPGYATPVAYPQQYGAYPPTYPVEYPSYPPAPAPYAPPYMIGYNPTEKNGLGVASLVLGIASFCCLGAFAGIIAIVLGVQGRKAADEGRATNRSLATAGMVLGIIGTVIVGLYWLVLSQTWYY